ncbi:MAG TPA: DNA-directed RNA polymerase subunit omega [Candidatus Limnocylindrales bacterium]|nr:DNA-directed RNA polymerase subunit omega [Candidatus Limnocylindrales bacterium]
MIYPSIDVLLKQVDSKYTLVIATSKRGRQLRAGARKTIANVYQKDVTTALYEIEAGNIAYERIRDGIK